MTTPIAANVDPALRERIAAAMTGIGEEAGSVIARVAERASDNVRGGESFERALSLASYAAARLGCVGRELTHAESAALSACIRAHLDAGVAPAHPSPAEMAREAPHLSDRYGDDFSAGVAAERARLRAILVAMAESGNADRTHVLALVEAMR